jgi:hypothetical protein
VPAQRRVGVRELVHERKRVADDQRDRNQHRLLGDRALARTAREREHRRDEQADDGDNEQGRVGCRHARAECLGPMPQPADQHARPEHEQQVPDDRAGQRRLDDLDQAFAQREERDDQLGDIAERGIEDAADLRAR